MAYKKVASALSIPVDWDRIERTVVYYANGKFHAEVYKNGTCVFPSVSLDGKVASGRELLVRIGDHPIDFTVKQMDDHNFIVRFNESVFSIVFADDYVENRSEIIRQATGAIADEVIVARPDSPEDHLFIGLFGRTRLLEDIQAPELVRAITPDSSSLTPR